MKILLDESLPRKLKNDFNDGNEIRTVRDMGWLGKKNGELMELMISNRFDAFITLDKNLSYQQNLSKYDIVIFILSSKDSRYKNLKPIAEKIISLIENSSFKKFNEVS